MELVRSPVSADDEESEFRIRSEERVVSSTLEKDEEAVSQRSGEDNTANRILDVSEVDISRMVSRVISHRVRLRDRPADELPSSALFEAKFKPPPEILQAAQGEDEVALDSVKDVLVQKAEGSRLVIELRLNLLIACPFIIILPFHRPIIVFSPEEDRSAKRMAVLQDMLNKQGEGTKFNIIGVKYS